MRFCSKVAVLNSSPRTSPLSIFCISLFNTPDSDNQLIRSALRAWTVFQLTQCPLLPTPWAGTIRWSLLHFRTFIHCGFALFLHARTIIYLCKYIQFKFTTRTLQCTGICTFALNWNHGGIFCDVHFAGHLRSNRTNVWSDKSNIRNVQSGGVRGLELRTAALK